jgi:hypothetical protein
MIKNTKKMKFSSTLQHYSKLYKMQKHQAKL